MSNVTKSLYIPEGSSLDRLCVARSTQPSNDYATHVGLFHSDNEYVLR